MCGGIEVVIEGGIHVIQFLWQHNSQEKDWGFLLIEACNASNEKNQTEMLWAARYECPMGAQFTLNCYHHWATLMVRDADVSGHFLHSK